MSEKRGRGRPRKEPPSRLALLELPPVPVVATDPTTADDALAALEQATRHDDDGAGNEARERQEDTPQTESAPASRMGSAPAGATGAPGLSPSSSSTNGTHKPAPAPKPPANRSLTGKQYGALKNEQLRTALAIAENRNDELEQRLREIVPAVTAAKTVALEKMAGVVISAIFDFAALATSLEEVRLDADEERELGELGAPAIAPYLGEYARHAPAFAFLAKLTTVVTTKVIMAKAARAEAAAVDGR